MAGEIEKFVAFIPVRGGSKSIPKKNIKPIGGKPLVHWVLSAAEQCAMIDKIYVSTDDAEIADVVRKFQGRKIEIFWRSSQTATDTASTEDAMLEFAALHPFSNIVLMQATSPLTTADDLTAGINLYLNSKADSLLSVVRQKRFIWREESLADGSLFIKPQNYDFNKRPRRQEFDGFLVENGAFYITSRDALLQTGSRLSGNVVGYEMDEKTYFEIDEPTDWGILDSWLSIKEHQENFADKCQKIKMLVMDCDGVLTDAGMYYTHEGNELKKFSTRDGMGISLLHKHGIRTAIITGENSSVVEHRAKKLMIDDVYLGIKDKKRTLHQLMEKYNLNTQEVAYIGDDINDIEVLKYVGMAFTVNDAMESVKPYVHYVTKANGGHGAVREACEVILAGRHDCCW